MSRLALGLAVATSIWNGHPAEVHVCPHPIDQRCQRFIRRARREARALTAWRRHRRHATAAYRGWLRSTRSCETRGQLSPYRTNTGNGFLGAYQFTLPSWRAVGGMGYPQSNPPLEQDYRAVLLLRTSGTGNWPVCG